MSTEAAAAWPASAAVPIEQEGEPELAAVRRAQQGDAEAFSLLVHRHQHLVYNLAFRFMRDGVLAEDMAQDAFLKAFRQLKGFRGDCSFSTWMYRVTASVCLSELKRRKKRKEVELLPFHDKGHQPCAHETADLPELIRGCIAKLPPRYAKVITLYYLKGIPYEEILDVLQVPKGTLKTWMHRARNQLRKIVEKELGAHGRG